jgi:hypothetical protein
VKITTCQRWPGRGGSPRAEARGPAISRHRDLLRDILKQHVSDGPRQQLGKRVVEHLELSGFEIDEERQTIRKKRPAKGHG